MRAASLIPAAVLALMSVAAPTWAAADEAEQPEAPIDLWLRLDAGLGPNICVNSGNAQCTDWPRSSRLSHETAGYGRLGATVVYPALVDFLGAGFFVDFGGYSPQRDRGSTVFQLAAMLRAFIPMSEEGVEVTAGIGLGFATWSVEPSWSWTGLTLPMTVGLGYELFENWIVGGDFSLQPRITGDAPSNAQVGVYIAYTFLMTIGDDDGAADDE